MRIGTNLSNFFHLWTWTFLNWFNNLIHLAEVQSSQIHSRIAWNRPSVFYSNHCSLSKKSRNGSFCQWAHTASSNNLPWYPVLTPGSLRWPCKLASSGREVSLWGWAGPYKYTSFIYSFMKVDKKEMITNSLYKISILYTLISTVILISPKVISLQGHL